MRAKIPVLIITLFVLSIVVILSASVRIAKAGSSHFRISSTSRKPDRHFTYWSGMNLVSKNTTDSVEYVARYKGSWSANEITLAGQYAYVVAGEDGIRIIDVSDPVSPQEIGGFDTPGKAREVAIAGHYAFVADESSLRIVDVADPAHPVEISYFDSPYSAYDVSIVENRAYISGWNLVILDISDPFQPIHLGSVDVGNGSDLAVSGKYAIAAGGGTSTKIIDVSNPNAPQVIGSWGAFEVTTDIAAIGDLVYLIDGYGFIEIITISNPERPESVGFLGWWDDSADGLALSDGFAYVVAYKNLYAIDVSAPSTPTIVASYPLSKDPNTLRRVATQGGYLYVADGENGLLVLKHTGADNSLPDLSIDSIEPVQVTEGQALVRNKDTAFKVVIRKTGAATINHVGVRLNVGTHQQEHFFVYDPANLAQYKLQQDERTFPLNFGPGESTKIVYFFSNELAPTGNSLLGTAVVDPGDFVAESSETNNTGTMPSARPVYPVPSLKVHFFPVDFEAEGQAGEALRERYFTFIHAGGALIRDAWPVTHSQFSGSFREQSLSTHHFRGFDERMSIPELRLWALSTSTQLILETSSADRYIGVVPEGWFGSSMSDSTLQMATGIYPGDLPLMLVTLDSLPTIIHEMAHSYGLYQDCEQYHPGCHGIGQELGLMADPGIQVSNRMPFLPGGNRIVKSFMSAGGADKWWYAQDYKAILEKRLSAHQMQRRTPTIYSKAILASGIIDKDGITTLTDWYVLPNAVLSDLSTGPYAFEYLNTAGDVIHAETFDLSFSYYNEEVNEAPFVLRIPYVDGMTQIRLTNNGQVLAVKTASQNPPVVQIKTPTANGMISSPLDVSWLGSDIDGDELTYTILISIDGGMQWHAIVHNLESTNYRWNMELPERKSLILKVIVTDGFNTAEDQVAVVNTSFPNIFYIGPILAMAR